MQYLSHAYTRLSHTDTSFVQTFKNLAKEFLSRPGSIGSSMKT